MSASLDSNLDPMEEIRFRKKHGAMWIEIQKDTHFSFDELERKLLSLALDVEWFVESEQFFQRPNEPYKLTVKNTHDTRINYGDFFQDSKARREASGVGFNIEVIRDSNRCRYLSTGFGFGSGNAGDTVEYTQMTCRAHFRDVLHTGLGMTDSYMMERVMVALDRGTSPYVTMATFAKAMSLYLRGSLEERISYAFTCYDLLGEGYLRRETMYQCMKKSIAKASRDDDVEEAVKEFVDIMLKRMDTDVDGVINFEDFHKSVTKTPSLLESLGYCLPERPAVYSFLATWCPNWGKM